MEEELNYLSEKIDYLCTKIDTLVEYAGIDQELGKEQRNRINKSIIHVREEKELLQNILNKLTETELTTKNKTNG